MSNALESLSTQETEELILELTAFAAWLIKEKTWFRGPKTEIYLMGKSVEDYVYETIEMYIKEPDKYKPRLGDFKKYLKYNILRSIIKRDSNRQENQTSQYIHDDNNEDDEVPYLERISGGISENFENQLDFDLIKEFIENEIKDDEIAENIFLGIYVENLKRRDIIKEFGISAADYDNGIRRIKTIIKKAQEVFNPYKHSK